MFPWPKAMKETRKTLELQWLRKKEPNTFSWLDLHMIYNYYNDVYKRFMIKELIGISSNYIPQF